MRPYAKSLHLSEFSFPGDGMSRMRASLSCFLALVCPVTQLYPTLCHPTDCSPQGSSVHGVFQTRILVAISFSRWSSHPGIEPMSLASPALAGGFFTTSDSCCFLTCIQVSQEAGRSGGLVFPSLSEFSTVYCDPHSQRLWHSQ